MKNPKRDLPWGIALTLSVCCTLYMMVSVVIVGLVPYPAMDTDTPISTAFVENGMRWAMWVSLNLLTSSYMCFSSFSFTYFIVYFVIGMLFRVVLFFLFVHLC